MLPPPQKKDHEETEVDMKREGEKKGRGEESKEENKARNEKNSESIGTYEFNCWQKSTFAMITSPYNESDTYHRAVECENQKGNSTQPSPKQKAHENLNRNRYSSHEHVRTVPERIPSPRSDWTVSPFFEHPKVVGWIKSSSTSNESGDRNETTLSEVIGRESTPERRGRIEPSAMKLTSPNSRSLLRICSWFSIHSTCSRRRGSLYWKNACSTISGTYSRNKKSNSTCTWTSINWVSTAWRHKPIHSMKKRM